MEKNPVSDKVDEKVKVVTPTATDGPKSFENPSNKLFDGSEAVKKVQEGKEGK